MSKTGISSLRLYGSRSEKQKAEIYPAECCARHPENTKSLHENNFKNHLPGFFSHESESRHPKVGICSQKMDARQPKHASVREELK